MNNKCICLVLMMPFFMVFHTWAATDPSSALTPLYGYQDDNQGTTTLDNAAVEQPESPSVLPFLGDEARKRGYDLPEPFGININ